MDHVQAVAVHALFGSFKLIATSPGVLGHEKCTRRA
jgi:hypothetical protein